MVGLPDSKTEPMLLNGTDITPYSSNATNNENLTDDTARIRDQAFALPRLVRPGSNSNNNNSYTLKFDVLDDKKVNADNINAEPVVVKKVAGKKTRGTRRRYVGRSSDLIHRLSHTTAVTPIQRVIYH